MNKIIKKIILAVVMVLLLSPLVGCQSEKADGDFDGDLPQVINIGYLRVPNDEMVAKTMGIFDDYFSKKGIECNFVVFDSGVDANKALASNSIDFATMGNTNGIIAFSRGLDVELIWIHEVLGQIEGLAVKNGSNINSAEDLRGKRIATPFASTSHYSLLNYLKNAGIEEDVELLDMLTADIVAAWERGDIEAAYTWQPTLGQLLENGRTLVNSEEMAKKGNLTANVCLVRKGFSKDYPEVVADFIRVLSEGGDAYRNNPQESAQAVAKELEITKEEALIQMEGSRWLTPKEMVSSDFMGSSTQAGAFSNVMKDTADFLAGEKSIDFVPTQEEFDAFINPTYIEMTLEN